eukprot:857885-Prorocentrum_minimum.AAC.3
MGYGAWQAAQCCTVSLSSIPQTTFAPAEHRKSREKSASLSLHTTVFKQPPVWCVPIGKQRAVGSARASDPRTVALATSCHRRLKPFGSDFDRCPKLVVAGLEASEFAIACARIHQVHRGCLVED